MSASKHDTKLAVQLHFKYISDARNNVQDCLLLETHFNPMAAGKQ